MARPCLREARNPDGSQRFYRFGEHPATLQKRKALESLREFRDKESKRWEPNTIETDLAIAYLEKEIAQFDAIEERAKREWVQAHA